MNSDSNYIKLSTKYTPEVLNGEVVLHYYFCPVKHCNLSHRNSLTVLQLVNHLITFHRKPTVCRVLAWFAVKYQELRP